LFSNLRASNIFVRIFTQFEFVYLSINFSKIKELFLVSPLTLRYKALNLNYKQTINTLKTSAIAL